MGSRPELTWLRRGAVTVALLLVAIWALSSAGRWVSTPTNAPDRADVIVALGGDVGPRILTAQALHARGLAPCILLTGFEAGTPITQPLVVEWRKTYLLAHGVSQGQIVTDSLAVNSWQEAQNTRALMLAKGWHRALVVSDPPHMRRLSWVWGQVFSGTHLEFRLVSSSPPNWDASHWWRDEKSAQFVLSELIKLAYYRIKY